MKLSYRFPPGLRIQQFRRVLIRRLSEFSLEKWVGSWAKFLPIFPKKSSTTALLKLFKIVPTHLSKDNYEKRILTPPRKCCIHIPSRYLYVYFIVCYIYKMFDRGELLSWINCKPWAKFLPTFPKKSRTNALLKLSRIVVFWALVDIFMLMSLFVT